MFKYFCIFIVLILFFVFFSANGYADSYEIVEIQGVVKFASGPPELLKLSDEGRITARALRAFGKLPEEFMSLVLESRSEGIDLLVADMDQLEQHVKDAESGVIKVAPERLRSLKNFLEERSYLNWEQLQVGYRISKGDLLFVDDGASLTLQDAYEETSIISCSGFSTVDATTLVFKMSEKHHDKDKLIVIEETLSDENQAKDEHFKMDNFFSKIKLWGIAR